MESKAEGLGTIDAPQQIYKLPEDIIAEILSRLAVKSLLKFKCVSKSWRSLISSKHFIKTHLENSTKNTSLAHHRIISTTVKPFWRLDHYSLPSLLCEQTTYSIHFDLKMDTPKRLHGLGCCDWKMDTPKGLHVLGCCNGLICVLIDKTYFFLWNPATRESKRLPDFHAGMKHIQQSYIRKYGFGFDESSDDYKIYATFSVIKSNSGTKFNSVYHVTTAKVYSLKADSWKRIEFVEDDSPLDAEGKFASGKLHWNRNSGLNLTWDIVSFDLKSEVFGIVEQPSYVEGGFYATLGVLNGCLCVLCDYCKTRLDVWIWNQYGVQDSWAKLVSISYPSDRLEGPISNPPCILPNGEVLFIHDSAFVTYNPERNWHWYSQIVDSVEFLGAEVYVESLVSPVPDKGSVSLVHDGGNKRGKARNKGRTNKKT